MQTAIAQKAFVGTSLQARSPRARKTMETTVVNSRPLPPVKNKTQKAKKFIDVSKQGVNSVQDEVVRLNLMGRSRKMGSKDWTDAAGRKGKGIGVYRFERKYGVNVDGYSPIYAPDTWAETGNTYQLGTKGLIAWAGLLVVLLGVGVNLVVSNSALGQ